MRAIVAVPVRPALRVPVDFLLGSWLFAALALALGLAHAWTWATLAVLVLFVAATGRPRRAGWRWGPVLPPVLAGLIVLPVALAPPFFYDALVYHLGLPWQALREGGLTAHPEDLFAAFPPLAQLLFSPFLSLGIDRAPAVLHWLGFVAAGAGVWALARGLGAPRWAAALAGGCVPLLPCCVLVPGLPAAEAWGLGGTVAAMALVAAPRWTPGSGALAGFLAGTAGAARMQGIPWGAVVVVAVVLRTRDLRELLRAALGFLAGCSLWWLKNLILLGDPLAPLFWHHEGVETLWRDAGSAMHTVRGVGGLARVTATALAPHAGYLALLALAAGVILAVRPTGRDRIVALAAVAGLGSWALTGNLPRFLGPVAALLLAMAAAAGGRSAAGRWGAALALGTTAALGLALSAQQLHRWGGLALPGETPAEVHRAMVVNDPFPAFAASGSLPAAARVLFVGEARGFGFPRRFVAPSQHDVSPLRAVLETSSGPGEACERLRREGFTHILVNWGELDRLAGGYPVAPWRGEQGWRRWTGFIAWLGLPAVQAGSVQVFALPASGSGV